MEANNGLFIDFEGRKPSAMITIGWEGDDFYFNLVVNGKERMRSKDRGELRKEAERIGAELEEAHTP